MLDGDENTCWCLTSLSPSAESCATLMLVLP